MESSRKTERPVSVPTVGIGWGKRPGKDKKGNSKNGKSKEEGEGSGGGKNGRRRGGVRSAGSTPGLSERAPRGESRDGNIFAIKEKIELCREAKRQNCPKGELAENLQKGGWQKKKGGDLRRSRA